MTSRRPGLDFDPEQVPLPPAAVGFDRQDGPRLLVEEGAEARWWAGKNLEQEHSRANMELEHLHCRRCKRVTRHAVVFWHVMKHAYDPPLHTIDGQRVAGLDAGVYVLWCMGHKGDPPARY